jgi:hypothetical protein
LTAAAAGGSLHVCYGTKNWTEIANHYFFPALLRLSETDFDVLVDFAAGLLAAVGFPCGFDMEAAIRFTALDGLRVLTPPGRRDAAPLDAKLEDEDLPPPCAILSAAVLP